MEKMDSVRNLISEIHATRKKREVRVRQPLYADFSGMKLEEGFAELIQHECNLISRDLSRTEGELFERTSDFGYIKIDLVIDSDLAVLGFTRDFERAVQAFRKAQGFHAGQLVSMNWQVASSDNIEVFNKVLQQIDWNKLKVEIKWVDNLDEKIDKKFVVKDLVEIIVD